MIRRPFLLVLVAPLALVVGIGFGGCAGGGKSSAVDGGDSVPVAAAGEATSEAAAPVAASKRAGVALPDDVRASLQRAHEFEKAGKLADAEAVYQQGMSRADLTNEQRAAYVFRFARLRFEAGRLDESRALANKALALRPGWGDATKLLERIDAKAKHGAVAGDAEKKAKHEGKKDKQGKGEVAKADDGTKKHEKKGDQPFAKQPGEKEEGKKRAKKDGEAKLAKHPELAGDATGQELAAMRKKAEAMRDQLHAAQTDRDLLKGRVNELEAKVAELQRLLEVQRAAK
ncbi:MAG: hypothetical protein K8T90_17760 [Planctomycetes bacterium]|nr:hypothetical protein [Planctomycetota bacterium]